ncbi:Copine-4 [Nymphon striatum]|nr:Copine-4 [Nymphon striatum]
MQLCDYEEADTRILVHILDALKNGAKSFFVRAVDTDVIVILAGHFYQLTNAYGPLDVWVGFGIGKNFRCYHVNSICEQLGERKANALPLFYAFTRCETTSSFSGKGKKTAWKAWKSYQEATDAFFYMKENPFDNIEIMSPYFEILEHLTVVMYDKSSSTSSTNALQRGLFTKQNRNLEHIPPTQAMSYQPPPPNQYISGQNYPPGTSYMSGNPSAQANSFPSAGNPGYPPPQSNVQPGPVGYTGSSQYPQGGYPQNSGVATGYPISQYTSSGPGYSNPHGNVSGQSAYASQPTAPMSGNSTAYHQPVPSSMSSQASMRISKPPPTTGPCTSKIELRISCKNLLDLDVTSKSDPMVALYIKHQNTWFEVGRTENIQNSLNPEFSKPIVCDYYFEEVQHARFEVYDIDNSTPELDDDDMLGKAEFTIAEIVSSNVISKNLYLKKGVLAGKGSITISVEEVDTERNEEILLSFSAKGLDKKDFLGKSDPFLEFRRKTMNGTWQLTGRTEVIKKNLNPTWRTLLMLKSTLCGKNPEEEIKITCFDYDDDGGHDLIGECSTNLLKMIECNQQPVTWTLINSKKLAKKGKSYKGSGVENALLFGLHNHWYPVKFHSMSSQKRKVPENGDVSRKTARCFAQQVAAILDSDDEETLGFDEDYLFDELETDSDDNVDNDNDSESDSDNENPVDRLPVAIDFTASNGDPKTPQSLHYINSSYPNEYMQAITAVGNVLQDYDSDKLYPALGFGAKIPPQYAVSHEFALNFNMNNPFCAGVDGLLHAYSNCLQQIQLYGPTNVAPIIHHAARFAQSAHSQNSPNDYFVLLILTDGVITDMYKTRDAIVAASALPLSIIIIGVGGANFADMNALDGDDGILRAANGTPAKRDIVQFVPFRKYSAANPALLAKEVLAEIPQQLTGYYKSKGMSPKKLEQNQ